MTSRKHGIRCCARATAALIALGVLGCTERDREEPIDTVALERLRSPDLTAATEAFLTTSRRLLSSQHAEEQDAAVAALEKTLAEHPVEMIAMLESRFGGASALRRYAQAMLASNRGKSLGGQLALALRGGDPQAQVGAVLSTATARDGSQWHGAAEDAGFFAGAIAWALERSADPATAAADIAGGLRQPAPERRLAHGSWSDWLRSAALAPERGTETRVSAPALRTFDLAFERMTQASR